MKPTAVRWGRRAFLIELLFSMIALGFCAAICLAGFVHADSISKDSRDLTESVILAQSAAEQFKADPRPYLGRTGEAVPLAYYDAGWKQTDRPQADGFLLQAACTERDSLLSAVFTVRPTQGDTAIFTLTAQKYLPQEKRGAGG